MTKKEIVRSISEVTGLSQAKVREVVQQTFDTIVDTLAREKRIELRNFGVFEVRKRAARKARNPKSGATIEVPEKYVVNFRPGKEMEEQMAWLQRREQMSQSADQPQPPKLDTDVDQSVPTIPTSTPDAMPSDSTGNQHRI